MSSVTPITPVTVPHVSPSRELIEQRIERVRVKLFDVHALIMVIRGNFKNADRGDEYAIRRTLRQVEQLLDEATGNDLDPGVVLDPRLTAEEAAKA